MNAEIEEGPIRCVEATEVEKVMRKMKIEKVGGLSEESTEM